MDDQNEDTLMANGDVIVRYFDPAGLGYVLNDGVRSVLAPNGLRGLGVVRASVPAMQLPYENGLSVLSDYPYTPAREVQIGIKIAGLGGDTAAQWTAFNRAMARACSAYKAAGKLGALEIAEEGGVTLRLDCWMVEWPDPERSGPFYGTVAPVFWAPSPWLYDPTERIETLAVSGDGGIEFAITFPITFDSTALDAYVYPDNQGDVPTWPTIRVNGPGSNIKVDNITTGQVFQLTAGGGVTLDAGDYVDIDMENATANWYDLSTTTTTSVLAKMSDASEFWALARGVNQVRVRVTAATSGSVRFSYYLRYQSF